MIEHDLLIIGLALGLSAIPSRLFRFVMGCSVIVAISATHLYGAGHFTPAPPAKPTMQRIMT